MQNKVELIHFLLENHLTSLTKNIQIRLYDALLHCLRTSAATDSKLTSLIEYLQKLGQLNADYEEYEEECKDVLELCNWKLHSLLCEIQDEKLLKYLEELLDAEINSEMEKLIQIAQ